MWNRKKVGESVGHTEDRWKPVHPVMRIIFLSTAPLAEKPMGWRRLLVTYPVWGRPFLVQMHMYMSAVYVKCAEDTCAPLRDQQDLCPCDRLYATPHIYRASDPIQSHDDVRYLWG